jgi:hypothetical protein
VGGQDRFHTNFRKAPGDLIFAQSGGFQFLEVVGPEARLVFLGNIAGAKPPELGGRIFLDHIQQLESDRVGLGQARGYFPGNRAGWFARYGDKGKGFGDLFFAQIVEDFPKTIDQEIQVVVDFGESAGKRFGGRCWGIFRGVSHQWDKMVGMPENAKLKSEQDSPGDGRRFPIHFHDLPGRPGLPFQGHGNILARP